MKRTPLRQGTPLRTRTALKRGKPLNRQSAKRKREQKELDAINRALRGTPCVVRWDAGCTGMAEQGDHILSRARGGKIADPANVRGVCSHCHFELTTHPAEAEVRGLTRHSWGAE